MCNLNRTRYALGSYFLNELVHLISLNRQQLFATLLGIVFIALSAGLISISLQQHQKANSLVAKQTLVQFEKQLLSYANQLTQISYQRRLPLANYLEFSSIANYLPNLNAITNVWLINADGTYFDLNTANPHQSYLATADDTDPTALPKNIRHLPVWSGHFLTSTENAISLFSNSQQPSSLYLAIPIQQDQHKRLLAVGLNLDYWFSHALYDQQLALIDNGSNLWANHQSLDSQAIYLNVLDNPNLILSSAIPFNHWLTLLPIPLFALLLVAAYNLQSNNMSQLGGGKLKLVHEAVNALDLLIVETDVEGTIVWMSKGASESLEVFNVQVGDSVRKHLVNHPRIVSYIHSSLQGDKLTYQVTHQEYEFRVRQQPRLDDHDQIIGLNFIVEDITEQAKLEKHLRHQQLHDKLTGLPNRQLFEQQLDKDIHKAKRHQSNVAILAIEINGLGNINKTFSHNLGDLALKHIATALRQEIRDEDLISRFSSDEFLVICEQYQDPIELRAIAQRVINRTTAKFTINHHELTLSANIGISTFPHDSKDAGSLISNAIAAMRHARQSGKNTLDYFSTDNAKSVQRKWQLEQSLANAVKVNNFELHYQPIFDVNTHQTKGAEALIRWPVGKIPPDRFIPIAEQAGLMPSIGIWVLESALNQLKLWQHQSSNFQYITVNVSIAQLKDNGFIDSVSKLIKQTPIKQGSVVLELTESIMATTSTDIIEKLHTLKRMGFLIAIDDFGVGYSSLNYLKHLPVDIIKIDKSFLAGVPKDNANRLICDAIINMARALNMNIVAEGIETPEQLAWLVEEGVTTAQGFYFAKPLPVDAFEHFLPLTSQ